MRWAVANLPAAGRSGECAGNARGAPIFIGVRLVPIAIRIGSFGSKPVPIYRRIKNKKFHTYGTVKEFETAFPTQMQCLAALINVKDSMEPRPF
ncbi:MAG: hypothetical protein HWE09_13725 [Cyclobacteriaceae bacterium]|nr:hypothetical protein [Cyclobacteriaceae bacterium]